MNSPELILTKFAFCAVWCGLVIAFSGLRELGYSPLAATDPQTFRAHYKKEQSASATNRALDISRFDTTFSPTLP